MRIAVALIGLISAVAGHPTFWQIIPNGRFVPNPCLNGIWEAVGHYSPDTHTHLKNPFGVAFKANGLVWTVELCAADSDNDGMTNGVELGDPGCVWTVGGTPSGPAIGHPGICEPIGSAQCSGQTFSCDCHGQACG